MLVLLAHPATREMSLCGLVEAECSYRTQYRRHPLGVLWLCSEPHTWLAEPGSHFCCTRLFVLCLPSPHPSPSILLFLTLVFSVAMGFIFSTLKGPYMPQKERILAFLYLVVNSIIHFQDSFSVPVELQQDRRRTRVHTHVHTHTHTEPQSKAAASPS